MNADRMNADCMNADRISAEQMGARHMSTGQERGTTMPQEPAEAADYALVRRVLADVTDNWRTQPSVEQMAGGAGVSTVRLERAFRRFAGLTPKQFLQAVTIDHARRLLQDDSVSVLDATFELGLSAPARLHDLFITYESMPPGAWRRGGEGLAIRWGWHDSPFGRALVMAGDRGLSGLAFADDGGEAAAFEDMQRRWPRAAYVPDVAGTAALAARVFDPAEWRPDRPLQVTLIGSDFEIRVWECLLAIPFGAATTYSRIAGRLGRPQAARAVGSAVGRNPVSFVVPCHRVLGKGGTLCGYHWGLSRKRAILGWEAGLAGTVSAPGPAA